MRIKSIYLILISILFFIASFIMNKYRTSDLDRLNSEYISFESVENENVKSFIYPEVISVNNKDFYIIYVNDKTYIVRTSEDIENIKLDGKYTRIIGTSKLYSSEDKNTIINFYNDYYVEEEDSKISEEIFDKVFGNYYLDGEKVVDDSRLGITTGKIASLFIELGIAFIVLFVFQILIDYKKQIY